MDHVQQVAPVSARRLRLLAVAYAQYLETQPDYAAAKHVSHLGEAVVEGRQTHEFLTMDEQRGWGIDGDWRIASFVLAPDDRVDIQFRTAWWHSALSATEAGLDGIERTSHARSLILCVIGNPFRPVAFDPRWRTADVMGIARGIYEDRAFDRLPLLADALMDAGFDDEQVIGHCRNEGPHARGCFVVDMVLGNE
jgi:hypothetical protein